MSDLEYVVVAYGVILLGVLVYVLRLAVIQKDVRSDIHLTKQVFEEIASGSELADQSTDEWSDVPGSSEAKEVWWRGQTAVRALFAGFPVVLIATIAIGFWVLSLVRGDEYKILPAGSTAPDFSLPTATGGQVSLDEHLGRHPFLLFFNEGMG